MKKLTATLLAVLPVLVTADIRELQAKLPPCSLGCLAEGAASFNCDITDLYCQCTQLEDIKKVVAPCLVNVGGCELDEIIGTVEVVAEMCVAYFQANNLTLPSSDSSRSSKNGDSEEGAAAVTAASISVAVFAFAATMFL